MQVENTVETYINCDCSCSILRILDWKSIDKSILSLYVSAFMEKQPSFFYKVKRRIKAAWCMLRGKEFLLYELYIGTEQLKNTLKEYLAKSEGE
jgi:hypothetical protein